MENLVWEMLKVFLAESLDLWPILLFVVVVGILSLLIKSFSSEGSRLIDLVLFKRGENWKSDEDIVRWLRGMGPDEFENYIAELFFRLGYKTRRVGGPNDGGIDVVIKKDGVKSYVQCKKFLTSEVPVGAVRDFYGAIADNLSEGKGYFVTTNRFTPAAKEFAESRKIELVDRYKLVRYVREARGEKRNFFGKKEEVNLICPECGGKLVKREGKFGIFYGCENYPKCKYTTKFEK